jgi:hypothetical protein
MIQDEKDRLIALFDAESSWCRGMDAVDADGNAVHYDDSAAVSWDIVGGLCHLFGWKRACKLFEPMSRHFAKRRHSATAARPNTEMAAMSALFDFNDDDETTHELFMDRLKGLPVWHGRSASVATVDSGPETAY